MVTQFSTEFVTPACCGATHFHVLFRLDGTHPDDPDRIVPPPPALTAPDLEDAVRRTAAAITWRAPGHPANPGGWVIGWGAELDVRTIATRGDGTVTDLAVASYLAKYATKGTETAGHASARITTDTIDLYAKADGTHPERLIHACWTLGTTPEYHGLRRWAHKLGFGGHLLTKARRYSVTLTALRQARITYRRSQVSRAVESGHGGGVGVAGRVVRGCLADSQDAG